MVVRWNLCTTSKIYRLLCISRLHDRGYQTAQSSISQVKNSNTQYGRTGPDRTKPTTSNQRASYTSLTLVGTVLTRLSIDRHPYLLPCLACEKADSEHSFIWPRYLHVSDQLMYVHHYHKCMPTLEPRTHDFANAVSTARRSKACERGDCVSEVSRMGRLCCTLHGGTAIPN